MLKELTKKVEEQLEIALTKGFVKVEGAKVSLTDTGKKEMLDILEHCYNISNDNNNIGIAAKELSTILGYTLPPLDFFKATLKEVIQDSDSSDVNFLGFLMVEKSYNFVNVTKATEMYPSVKKSRLSLVKNPEGTAISIKRPKYDA